MSPWRSAGVRIGLLAVNWRAPVFQAPRIRTPVFVEEALLEGVRRGAREEAVHVFAVVEHERAVDGAHGRVERAQRRRALDVHVDVAGDDRRDPFGVGAELARTEDVDGQADVRGLGLVLDHLGAAGHLWLRVLVAVRSLERDRRSCAAAVAGAAVAGAAVAGAERGTGRGAGAAAAQQAASSSVAAIATGMARDRVVMVSPIRDGG